MDVSSKYNKLFTINNSNYSEKGSYNIISKISLNVKNFFNNKIKSDKIVK